MPGEESPARGRDTSPWLSIEGVDALTAARGDRSFHEMAAENPCLSCHGTPCCWYLHLESLRSAQFMDFDYIRFLLNFDGVEVTVNSRGDWNSYWRRPCSHLRIETGACDLHGTPAKPKVCVRYNPHACFYRRALSTEGQHDTLRLDRARFERVLRHLRFDAFGQLTSAPPFSDLQRVARQGTRSEETSPERDELAPPVEFLDRPIAEHRFDGSTSPCEGCSAPCCRHLIIRREPPNTFNDLDYMKYAVGFENMSIGVTPEGLAWVIRATCRHFDVSTSRCGVFGRPTRPKWCSTMDEWNCYIKDRFVLRPDKLVTLRSHQEFAKYEALFTFEPTGAIRTAPSFDQIRRCFST